MSILDDIDADLIEAPRLASSVLDQVRIVRNKRGNTGRALSAREALEAIHFEAQIVMVAAQNMAQGMALEMPDLTRLMVAWACIDFLIGEAVR